MVITTAMTELTGVLNGFKASMYGLKAEVASFKDDMASFKDEVRSEVAGIHVEPPQPCCQKTHAFAECQGPAAATRRFSQDFMLQSWENEIAHGPPCADLWAKLHRLLAFYQLDDNPLPAFPQAEAEYREQMSQRFSTFIKFMTYGS